MHCCQSLTLSFQTTHVSHHSVQKQVSNHRFLGCFLSPYNKVCNRFSNRFRFFKKSTGPSIAVRLHKDRCVIIFLRSFYVHAAASQPSQENRKRFSIQSLKTNIFPRIKICLLSFFLSCMQQLSKLNNINNHHFFLTNNPLK